MNQTTSILNANHPLARQFVLSIGLISIAFVTASHAAVVPPDQSYARKTYPEWTAASWVSAWAFPRAEIWTGADMLRNQSGPVWYLGGVGTTNPVTLHIRVPHDQALFVTFDGVACSTVEGRPFYGGNEAELRAA